MSTAKSCITAVAPDHRASVACGMTVFIMHRRRRSPRVRGEVAGGPIPFAAHAFARPDGRPCGHPSRSGRIRPVGEGGRSGSAARTAEESLGALGDAPCSAGLGLGIGRSCSGE
jgi:hypothetical protein